MGTKLTSFYENCENWVASTGGFQSKTVVVEILCTNS